MIVAILFVIILVMLFTGRSGNRAYEQAAEEERPVQKALNWGEFGCMTGLLALAGALGVFMLLGALVPGS